jgi:hypothetical protein
MTVALKPAAGLLALLLVALATGPALAKSVHPKSLSPVQDASTHRLAQDYVFIEKAATFTLAAGDYLAAYEDRNTVYLLGDGECLEMKVVPPKNPAAAYRMGFRCGIMLPRDPAKGAAFFTIRGHIPAKRENGLVINAIIAHGEGKFLFPTSRHDDRQLRAQLQQQPKPETP